MTPRSLLIWCQCVHVARISPRRLVTCLSWHLAVTSVIWWWPMTLMMTTALIDSLILYLSPPPPLLHETSKCADSELIPFPSLRGPKNCFCEKKSCQFCLTWEIKTVWSAAVLSMCARCEKKHYNSCILIVPIVPNITSDHMTCHDASWPW